MTDERKQEQQRKLAERMVFDEQMRVARKIMSKNRGILAALAKSEREDEIKDALCGPYGRFFNEGTD